LRNIKLTIEYDGTRYHGWQRQKDVPETIEGKLEAALSALLGGEIDIQGASRTDAGVHALGQVANFATEHPIPCANLVRALNDKLPGDIAVREAVEVPPGFNSRFSARGKRYRYTVDTSAVRRPVTGRFALHWKHPVDLEAIQAAMKTLEGEHDFAAFAAEVKAGQNTVRTLTSLSATLEGAFVHMDVAGTAFLYNMVRAIAGTLLDMGRGRLKPEDMSTILESRDRGRAGPTLPACGLTLVEISYDSFDPGLDNARSG